MDKKTDKKMSDTNGLVKKRLIVDKIGKVYYNKSMIKVS